MRLRTFKAPTMAEAMRLMRAGLGEDAVIVATHELPDGVRVTAAVDAAEDDLTDLLTPSPASSIQAEIGACLDHHHVPAPLRDALLAELARVPPIDPATALAHALAARFRFVPLVLPLTRPAAMVGPPGAGKTAAVAKLAAEARVAGHAVHVVAADHVRAGAREQLTALLKPLGLQPIAVAGSEALGGCIGKLAAGATILIDTTGINPFRGGEVAALAELVRAARAEPVLVLPAGLDGEDAIEMASNFAAIGARRLVIAKLDAARRLGSILAAADVGLALANASISPVIGRSMAPLTAAGLARVLLRQTAGPGAKPG